MTNNYDKYVKELESKMMPEEKQSFDDEIEKNVKSKMKEFFPDMYRQIYGDRK